jgi:ABC-2 type transport system permease protein
MDKLWQTRLRRHQKEQAKYLQRVFNDHFVLVLLVMFGALLYAYSNFVRQITGHPWWVNVVVALACAAVLPLGHLATMLTPADVAFLLPQAGKMRGYLNQARRYSMMLPMVLELSVSVTMWPLMTVGGNPNVALLVGLIVQQLTFAYASMSVQLTALFAKQWHRARYGLVLLDFIFVLVGLFTWLLPVCVVGTLVAAAITYMTIAARQHAQLDMLLAVKREGARMATIYRFYKLFTDVPGLGGGVKRRQYLDPLVNLVKAGHAQTWSYLFVRGLLRSQEYFGLCIRLIVVGAIAVWLTPTWWLALIVDCGFSYLLGYQLLPLATRYRDVVFTHIYPVAADSRKQAWQKLVTIVLLVQAVVIGVVALVHAPSMMTVLAAVIGLAFVPVLVRGYLIRRIGE